MKNDIKTEISIVQAAHASARISVLETLLANAGWTKADDGWIAPEGIRADLENSYGAGNWKLPQAVMFLTRGDVHSVQAYGGTEPLVIAGTGIDPLLPLAANPFKWKALDTAPRDGREIEVRQENGKPCRVRWSESRSGRTWHLTQSVVATVLGFHPDEWRHVSAST
jgi:hypothetical protein